MSDQFPMFRLGTLLMRQISAPVASRIKEAAKRHPRVGKTAVCGLGRACRGCEMRLALLSAALSGRTSMRAVRQAKAPPITTEQALQAGGNILGEVVIFMLGAMIIVLEVNRQAMNKERKVAETATQWLALVLTLQEVENEVRLQQEELQRLAATLPGKFPEIPPLDKPAVVVVPPVSPTPEIRSALDASVCDAIHAAE